jgi:hypothetical protein
VASKRITTLVQDISLLIHALGLRGSGAFGDGSPVYLVVQLLAPVRNGDAVVARIAPILAMDESAKVPCLVLSAPACSFLAAAQPRLPLPASAQVQVRFGAHNGLKSDIAPCPKSAKLGSDGLPFRVFNALRGRAFFPDRQREAQLLPNITQRGCA